MKFLKKYDKVIGSIITVLALVFVVKKLVTMDVDWSRFADGKTLAVIVGCTLVQTAMVLFMTLPWLRYIRILSGIQIPTKSALPVYTRSNLMKYVPGNVFQYVGRNQLAADLHISHVDVACATLLDIVSSMVTPLLLILLLRWKFQEPLKRYFEKYRKLLNRKNIPRILVVFLLYLSQYIISTAMYGTAAYLLFDVPAAQMGLFLGTYLFSWIIGFITPGAPGGIGIREAVMVLMCGSFVRTETIMLYAVTMRIISTLGDVVAFLVGLICEQIWKRKATVQ